MPTRKYKLEQIVTLLRQVEVELANGKTTPQVCEEAEITAQTYYPLGVGIWRIENRSGRMSQGTGARERQAEPAAGRAVFGEANFEGMWQRETSKP
jgi:putative transposase